jgi:hypothetical protein
MYIKKIKLPLKKKKDQNFMMITEKKSLSERLLFNANSTIFQLYHDGENKLIINEMMMRSALY